jgi:hypothetical protein
MCSTLTQHSQRRQQNSPQWTRTFLTPWIRHNSMVLATQIQTLAMSEASKVCKVKFKSHAHHPQDFISLKFGFIFQLLAFGVKFDECAAQHPVGGILAIGDALPFLKSECFLESAGSLAKTFLVGCLFARQE